MAKRKHKKTKKNKKNNKTNDKIHNEINVTIHNDKKTSRKRSKSRSKIHQGYGGGITPSSLSFFNPAPPPKPLPPSRYDVDEFAKNYNGKDRMLEGKKRDSHPFIDDIPHGSHPFPELTDHQHSSEYKYNNNREQYYEPGYVEELPENHNLDNRNESLDKEFHQLVNRTVNF